MMPDERARHRATEAALAIAAARDSKAAERAAYAAALDANYRCDAALTLVYNEEHVSRSRMIRDLRAMHSRIDRAILGRRYHLAPAHQRTQFWAVIEKRGSYPHLHLGLRMAGYGGIRTLDDLLKRGLFYLRAIAGEYKLTAYGDCGWAAYACKALSDPDDLILSSDFIPIP